MVTNPPTQPEPQLKEFSSGPWSFSAVCGSISGREELDSIQQRLHGAHTLPEMLFGSNSLSIKHETGLQIKFDAVGALAAWVEDPAPQIHVKSAQKWSESNATEIKKSNATMLDYDWTFTTSYAGEVVSAGGTEFTAAAETFSRELLLERAPILFSAEVPLYESEMDDNGISACTVRIRVMPKCWFVLLRFWLRVDGVLMRMREARYYCAASDTAKLWREVKHVEGTYDELAHAGAPCSNAAFADADSASTCMQAVAPIGVRLLSVHTMSATGSKA